MIATLQSEEHDLDRGLQLPMIVQLRLMLLGAMLLALTANGQTIYRCDADGKTTFSDKPCDGSSQGNDPAAKKPTVAQPKPDSPDPMSGYATPHGTWRGQAQYQAKVGTELVEQAHAVVPVVLSIGIDGKVTGGSPENGCRLLGIASPGVMKTMLKLDVTFSQCRYTEFNRRYGGFIAIYVKDKTAQLNLNAHVVRAGMPPRFFDLKGTLRR